MRLSLRRLLWGLLVVALAAVAVATIAQRTRPPLPVLGQVPDFTLTNRDGRAIGLGDLAGTPWVADFVFTRCGASCPMMTSRMARMDRELPSEPPVHLVSFTVDPVHDIPSVLARYATAAGATPRWLFLTGDGGQIAELSRQGFKLGVDSPSGPAAAGEAVLHSTRFVLVDGRGRIRRYYDAFDRSGLAELPRDLEAVTREP